MKDQEETDRNREQSTGGHSDNSASRTTGTTPGGEGSEGTANDKITRIQPDPGKPATQSGKEASEFSDKHSSDHEIEEIQGTDRAVTEESQEGILRGTAEPADNTQRVGGAQTGLEEGETWENDKNSKAINQKTTTTWNKETSGSTQGKDRNGITSHKSQEDGPVNPK